MAFSCSTSLVAPPISTKFVAYVPRACKPKPKPTPKTKSMATTKTAKHSRSGVDSKDSGEWFDDFPMPDSNASRSFDPGVPAPFRDADSSGSLDQDVVGSLDAAPFPEKPEHYQLGRDSLDEGGTDHATSIAKTNSAVNGLVDGSSPEFPLLFEGDAAEEHHSTTHVEPSNGASDYRENGFYAAASNEGYRTGQHGDLNAAGMCALSVEDMEGIRHERSPAADEPLFGDISVTSRPSLARKRTDPSSADTIISSAAAPDVTSEPEPEDTRPAKRRRPAKQRAESLILDPVSTPKSTPLRTPSGPVSRSRASNEPSPGPLGSDSKGDGAGTPGQLPNDLLEENGDDSAYIRGTVEELLHSPRQSTSPFEGIEDEQDIDPNSDRHGKKRKGSGSKVAENLHELNQVDKVSRRPSAKTSQRRKRSDRPVREKGHGPSRTALRPRGSGTMPTRASQPRQLYRPRIDSVTRSWSPRTSASGTKAGDGTNIHYGPSLNMSYQITDLTLCPVPKGSSIVTAIVRYRDSKSSLDPVALDRELLGGEGKVIRMTQLPDSWLLLGYRYDDGASGPCTRGSLNADWMSNLHSDAASHETDHPDDDWDEEDENGEEDTGEYKPPAPSSDQGFNRDDMRFHQQTRKPWLKSDEQRLLSYKERMDMEWKDIFERFPDRTPGAIRTRWHMLRRN